MASAITNFPLWHFLSDDFHEKFSQLRAFAGFADFHTLRADFLMRNWHTFFGQHRKLCTVNDFFTKFVLVTYFSLRAARFERNVCVLRGFVGFFALSRLLRVAVSQRDTRAMVSRVGHAVADGRMADWTGFFLMDKIGRWRILPKELDALFDAGFWMHTQEVLSSLHDGLRFSFLLCR